MTKQAVMSSMSEIKDRILLVHEHNFKWIYLYEIYSRVLGNYNAKKM